MSSHLRKTGRRAWADWDAMDMKLNFGFRPGHKDRWWENWLNDMNDKWPKETLTRWKRFYWKGVSMGRLTWSAEFQETWTVSGSQPLQQTNNDTISAYHRPRLWGVMTKASYVFWSEKRKFSFFCFPFLLLLPFFSAKMKNKVHPTRTTFSSFQWKKLL